MSATTCLLNNIAISQRIFTEFLDTPRVNQRNLLLDPWRVQILLGTYPAYLSLLMYYRRIAPLYFGSSDKYKITHRLKNIMEKICAHIEQKFSKGEEITWHAALSFFWSSAKIFIFSTRALFLICCTSSPFIQTLLVVLLPLSFNVFALKLPV